MMLVFDQNRNRYDIPLYIINKPLKYGNPQSRTIKNHFIKNENIEIIMRCAKVNEDFTVFIETLNSVVQLKEIYAQKYNLDAKKIRLFYSGRELKSGNLLNSYKLITKTVLNVFVIDIQERK